jgi:hypothetical protein
MLDGVCAFYGARVILDYMKYGIESSSGSSTASCRETNELTSKRAISWSLYYVTRAD